MIALSKVLWENNVPFLNVQTTGFLGWMRIQLNEHTIIESHPDNPKVDLRLDAPFPELVTHMDSIKIEGREDAVKTPWFILLYKALQMYLKQDCQNGNSGDISPPSNYPTSSKQKNEFKGHLKQCKLANDIFVK